MKKKVNHSKLHKGTLKISRKELAKNMIWIVIILIIFYFSIRIIGTDNIQEKVQEAGIFGPLILIIMKASTIVFAPLGGMPIYLAAGTLFGFFKGLLYIIMGDFLGFTISFYISRFFGRKIVKHFLSKKGMGAVRDVIKHMGTTKGLLQSCLVFIGFPEAISYGAGLTKRPYLKSIPVILIVELIPVALLVGLGGAIIQNFGPFSLTIMSILLTLIVIVGVFWLHNQARKKTA